MENDPNNPFVQFATANRDRYAAAADFATLLKRALFTGAISWEQAEAACAVEGIVVYDLMKGRTGGFDVDSLRAMGAAVGKALADSVITDVYIDEHRTRYYPISAEAHFRLQRRLEVAQEALKPFARQADMIDQSGDGWLGANQKNSIYELGALLRARDVLRDQKAWDRLPEVAR